MTPEYALTSKELRVVLALSTTRSINDAAGVAHLSQPALSRALARAESRLGVQLFRRGWSGTAPTALGEIVIGQCRQIYDDLEWVDRDFLGSADGVFARRVRWRHLDAVAAVTRSGTASAAANVLGVSQPAISQSIGEIAALLPDPLFTRGQSGLLPTPQAEALTALWDRTKQRLAGIGPLIDAAGQELTGRVAVGMLPFSGQNLVLESFADMTRMHPRVQLVAVPGGYNALTDALRRDEIDLFIGILRNPAPVDGFIETPLYDEEFTMIARADHPIHDAPVTIEALAKQQWVVAPHGTPIRAFFERVFREAGTTPPAQSCEIFSFSNSEQMIEHGTSLACLCYGPAALSQMRPGLRRVEVDLPDARVPIGMTWSQNRLFSPAIETFLNILQSKIAEQEQLV